MAVFEGKKSSNDIINNDTISDDEVVASDVPPRYLFFLTLILAEFNWGSLLGYHCLPDHFPDQPTPKPATPSTP